MLMRNVGVLMLPQPYNNPSTYPNHSGVDYGQPMDKAIYASGNGKIIFVGWLNDRAGWSVIVSYDAGCDVLYAHQPVHPPVAVNKFVRAGDYLGRIGSSGNSTGPHLHMEIMRGNGAHTYNGVWNYFDKTAYIAIGGGSSGGDSKPLPQPEKKDEEEEMGTPRQIHYSKSGKVTRALIVPGTEYFMPWTESGSTYANNIARNMETGSSTEVTESLFNAFKAAAERCARTTVHIDTVEA